MISPKQNILIKSLNLFLQKSYESVTLRDIQDATGASRGAIYHHFRSKEEIYEQVLNEFLLPAFNSYTFVEEEEKKSLINTIYAALKYRQNYTSMLKEATNSKINDYDFFKLIYQANEHSENFKEQTNWLMEKEFKGWKNTIQYAIRTGEIRSDIDIDYIAQYFVMAPLGLGNLSAFNKYIHIDTNDVRSIYTKFYNLLQKKSNI